MSRFKVPVPTNEAVKDHAPGSPEREELLKAIEELKANPVEVPLIIGGEEVKTDKQIKMTAPHDHNLVLGVYHQGGEKEARMAVEAALEAQKTWALMPWEHRAAIFLKAADMISGPYRAKMNAATMLAHSKTIYQSEIEAVCELSDFYRFGAYCMQQIYDIQPISSRGIWNRMDHRPLEGFIFAVTPFNFVAINGNLPAAPAMMGNVSVWKPASSVAYTSHMLMSILREAGLPGGVINLLMARGSAIGDAVLKNEHLAGIHFTGSTATFQRMWKTIGENIANYRSYPRIVGETGGKDFIFVHNSANVDEVVTAMVRGCFEYQGQKCSASSRCYIPKSLWPQIKEKFVAEVKGLKMGDPEDFTNFVNAVIDEAAFESIVEYIEHAKQSDVEEILAGGGYDKSKGYFIEPTVVLSSDPRAKTMEEEIFGPVVTIYVYEDEEFAKTLHLCDETSPYALTGAIFGTDRQAIALAERTLRNAAGNFYINDKPTGAVVGQQPFGGARASGTNDKAGALQNLLRWASPRSIKETFSPPRDYRYPFMG